MLDSKKSRGPGIAVVGYLTVVLSAGLIVLSLNAGQFAELPPWGYSLPMLLGFAGAVAGFVIGAGGIAVTWASFRNTDVDLDWLTVRTARLQHLRSTFLFKWMVLYALAALISWMVVRLGFKAGLPISGVFALAAATFVYLGIVAKLWQFLSTELSQSDANQ